MKIKNIIFMILGFIFLGLGLIGMFLPIWPTTPFVIAGAGCLSSTPKVYSKIMKVPFFNEHIRNYKNKKGLTKKTVFFSLFFLWVMLIFSMISMKKLYLNIFLLIVGVSVTIHILWVSRDRSKSSSEVKEL